ncbi:MAG: AMP-binding protein [Streptosporangiaceae bacterium]
MSAVQRKRPEHWAAETPDVAAVVDGDRQLTYRDWNQQANQLAEALAGFQPAHQRVCVCLHQCMEWFAVNLALAKLGWEHIAISWRLTTAEQLRLIDACGAAILVTDGPDAGELGRSRPAPRLRVVRAGPGGPGVVPFAALLDGPPAPPRVSSRPAPFVKYTSGTTGEPKGVRRPAANSAEQRQRRLESDRGPLERMRAAMADGGEFHHRALLTLPMHHGIGPRGARACHNEGGTCYLLDRYDPQRALELISRNQITHWTTVPTMLQRMRTLPAATLASYDVSSMRMLAVGSAPVPMPLKEWALGYFGPCLFEAYGASEVGLVTLMEPQMHLRKPGSCGALRPHVSVKVIGADGREQPPGNTGELYVRTPLTIGAYIGEPAQTGPPVPVQASRIRYVYAHVLAGGDGLTVIDPGCDSWAAWAALRRGLGLIGARAGDVTAILVTHGHPDHHGLTGRLRAASAAWVGMHRADSPDPAHAAKEALDRADLARAMGVPGHSRTTRPAGATPPAGDGLRAVPDRRLADGDVLGACGRLLRVIATPGHTAGHLCILDEEERILYAGDHLLPTINPNVWATSPRGDDPVADYLTSLDRIARLDVDHVACAHQYHFLGAAERSQALRAHHVKRLDLVLDAVTCTPDLTCWQLVRSLPWSTPFPAMSRRVQRYAARTTMAHLMHLERGGLLARAGGGTDPDRWCLA